jgi:glycosyltransferase involved in cell wall biosynthesis
VVPLGVDPALYRPLPAEEREALRTKRGARDTFVFLNVGMMTWNKGTPYLLKAFAVVADRHPQARLLLKGSDALGPTRQLVEKFAQEAQLSAEVRGRITYLGQPLAAAEMAGLYQMADAYVSPYLAEGFNLPVLEAVASGLPVICTAGGPTDDFTRDDFALYVRSTPTQTPMNGESRHVCVPDLDHLIHQMEHAVARPEIASRARATGPAWAAERYSWQRVTDQLLEVIRTN